MITKKTVLVLGAGASMPMGFPSAKELRHRVIRLTESGNSRYLLNMGFTSEETVQFSNDLIGANGASVDAFLEHRTEPRYRMLGKAAMAVCLIRCENPSAVSAIENEHKNWCRPLLEAMDCPFKNIQDNQLSVVTFNYDRSLEHCLLTAFQGKYGRTVEECLEALSTIRIIHIHGQLGEYPAEEYNPDYSSRDLKSCADQIKIPQDLSSDGSGAASEAYSNAQKEIVSAERICFIGFGYYRLNLERLGLQQMAEQRSEWHRRHPHRAGTARQDIWGTSYNLPPKTDRMLRSDWPMIDLRPQSGKEFLDTITLDD